MLIISWIIGISLIWILYHKLIFSTKPFEITTTNNLTKIKIYPSYDNHYKIYGFLNNYKIDFLIDTGATNIAISNKLARKLGIKKLNTVSVRTASGETVGYRAIIDSIKIGPITFSNVSATIMPNMDDDYALLGMNILKHFKIEKTKDYLILTLISNT